MKADEGRRHQMRGGKGMGGRGGGAEEGGKGRGGRGGNLKQPLRHVLRERCEVGGCGQHQQNAARATIQTKRRFVLPAAVSQGSARALSCSHEMVEHKMLSDFPVPVGDSKMPMRLF